MVADFDGRVTRVREKMQVLGGQGWLLTDPGDVRYVCGFTGSSPALVDGAGVTVFPHGVDLAQALDEVPWCTCIRRKGLQPWPEVVQVLQERGIRQLVAARQSLTVLAFESITQAGVEIVDAGQGMNDLRGVKDPGEIESLRRAAEIASEAFGDLLEAIRPGMSEKEIAAHLEHAMLSKGADGFWFRTIVVSGPRSAYCHGAPTERRVREGDLVTISGRCGRDTPPTAPGPSSWEIRLRSNGGCTLRCWPRRKPPWGWFLRVVLLGTCTWRLRGQ